MKTIPSSVSPAIALPSAFSVGIPNIFPDCTPRDASSAAISGAMELVIGNHLASSAPVVLEGDFLLPSLAVRPAYDGIPADGQVRAVFLYEEDEQQILRNYRAREGTDQPHRARVSWYHSEWLRREADRLGVPAVPARPWHTVLERVIAAL